jgi:hypothetical protein
MGVSSFFITFLVRKRGSGYKATKASLDTHFSLSRGKNNFQLNKKIGTRGFCHLCGSEGEIVEKFPRRGYGKFGAGFYNK